MTARQSLFLLLMFGCALALSACDKPETKKEEPAKAADKAPADKGGKAAPSEPGDAPPMGIATEESDEKPPADKGSDGAHPALSDPSLANEKAPDSFKVKFETTKGDFIVEVTRAWSPNGADRIYNLVKIGFFKDLPVFRVVAGFMAQFGIPGDPKAAMLWAEANINDDPVKESNARGTMTFATAGPNTRSTQFFINYADNARLDGMGFSPFGKVVEGMDVVDGFYSEYGDGPPNGAGPSQGRLVMEGVGYLRTNFPKLDYIKAASLVE